MSTKLKPRTRTPVQRRRHNPIARSENPGGIGSIVMNGFWIFAGQWAGGFVGGITGSVLGGITGSLGPLGGIALGLVNAYIVGWIGSRVGGHGPLMAAGAFAGSVGPALSGVLGGVGSIFGGGGGPGVQTVGTNTAPNPQITPIPTSPLAPQAAQPPASPQYAMGAPGPAIRAVS